MAATETSLLILAAGTAAVLICATVAGRVMALRCPDSEPVANFNARTFAWWLMVVALLIAFWTGRSGTILLFAACSALGLWEYLRLGSAAQRDKVTQAAAFLVFLPVQYGLIWIEWYGLFSIFIPVYGFLFLPVLAAIAGETRGFMARVAQIQWGLLLGVYCLSHVPALLLIKIQGFEGRNILLVAFLIIVVESSDVFQYLWGKLLGQHKIAPALSPGKTVEGLVGGIATASLLGTALYGMTPFTPVEAFGVSLMVTAMGFLGGLVMSAIKRDRSIKDWGHLIPGHGGMLDRLDAVLFSAPIYFHVIRYWWSG